LLSVRVFIGQKDGDVFKNATSYQLTLIFALAAIFVWLAQAAAFGYSPITGDGWAYLALAQGQLPEPPQTFHILTPWTAGYFFPANPLAGFAWIAALSFAGTTVMIDLLVMKVLPGATVGERCFAAGVFMATSTGAFMFRAYFLTDSASYFFLAAACVAVVYQRNALLAIITLIAVFNLETALFIGPVWLIFNLGRVNLAKLAGYGLAIFAPALAGYFLLHRTSLFFGKVMPNINLLDPATISKLWHDCLSWLGTDNIYYGLGICVFLAYSVVWPVAFRGLFAQVKKEGIKAAQPSISLWGFWLPVLAALAIVDWRRGFQPLFPAMAVSSIWGLRVMTRGVPKIMRFVFTVTTVIAAFVCTEAWWYTPMKPQVMIATAVWIGVTAIILVQSALRQKRDSFASDSFEEKGNLSI
jgi:hypothetical protein